MDRNSLSLISHLNTTAQPISNDSNNENSEEPSMVDVDEFLL